MRTRRGLSEVDRLRLVVETQRAINAVLLDTAEVMRVVTERAQAITEADGGVVELAEGNEMVYRAVSGSAGGSLDTRLNIENSLSGLCVRRREPLRCDDTSSDPRVDRDACERIGVGSMIVVPLLHGDEALGVLKVMSGETRGFDDVDLDVLKLMAEFIADSLTHSSAYGALGHLATHDTLTGLPNRALLLDRLDQALRRAKRQASTVVVFFFDLDRFKHVNDTLGHAAGDSALRGVSQRLGAVLRSDETLARLGGDEFVLVCENATDATVEAVSKRVHGAVAEVDDELGRPGLGVSIGWVSPSGSDWAADDLLARADEAMYKAKRAGRSDQRRMSQGSPGV